MLGPLPPLDAGGLADRNLRDFVQTFQAHIWIILREQLGVTIGNSVAVEKVESFWSNHS